MRVLIIGAGGVGAAFASIAEASAWHWLADHIRARNSASLAGDHVARRASFSRSACGSFMSGLSSQAVQPG